MSAHRVPAKREVARRTLWLMALAALPCVAAGASPPAPDPRALLHQYKCDLCHAEDAPKAGPALRDVAAAYRAQHRPASSMVKVIRDGQHGGGPWHMPPHPEVSREEAQLIARYVLSLD